MVGTGRFELPTPRTPSECSTRLSHVPTAGNPLDSKSRASGGVDTKNFTPAWDFVRTLDRGKIDLHSICAVALIVGLAGARCK